MPKTKVGTRIEARISPDVKEKAQEELSKHGLTISEYVRAAITTVANQGLPEDFGIPSKSVMESLNEVVDDISGSNKLPGYKSSKSLMDDLDND